ncbi:MAG: LytR C-terminal domain-containing protein, partial [Acidimicrobiales bacterium]|nr:LytR C-terminal domain-containing protein [Acidimicrobiales bacterium]
DDGSGDGTPDEGAGDGTPDDGSGDGTGDTTTSTLFPTITEPPSEVQVLVANGSGTARAAGSVTQLLVPKGYATLPPANAQPTDSTMIFFRPGMVAEARAVMEILAPDSPDLLAQIPPTGLAVAENALDRLESADIVVILGADGRIHNG